jgi:hypothetical protein
MVEDGQVRRLEVVEAALVQPFEHVSLNCLPCHAKKRSDQRRAEWACVRTQIRKVI